MVDRCEDWLQNTAEKIIDGTLENPDFQITIEGHEITFNKMTTRSHVVVEYEETLYNFPTLDQKTDRHEVVQELLDEIIV